MALLEDIRARLSDEGVFGGATGWVCTIGLMPSTPDKNIALIETGGFAADTLSNATTLPTFQVVVRSTKMDYSGCRAKWQDAFDALQDAAWSGVSPDTLGDYAMIQAMQTGPLQLGLDEGQRHNMSVNFRVIKITS